jgi:hypothetical protein
VEDGSAERPRILRRPLRDRHRKHHMSHTFAPWHCIPFATPRAAAIHWAEKKRQRMERDEATDAW